MPETRHVTVHFDDWKHETEKANLFVIGDIEVWIPKSVIEDVDEKKGEIVVAEWWASKEGLV